MYIYIHSVKHFIFVEIAMFIDVINENEPQR